MHWLAALVILLHLILPASRSAAQTSPEVTDLGADYKFGERITFRVRVQPVADVRELTIFITPDHQATVFQKVALDQANDQGEITQVVDARQIPLEPFSTIQYRYQASLNDGSTISTDAKTISYDDNRFNWQSLDSGIFQVRWYGTDTALGQQIVDIAQQGLQHAQTLLKATPPAHLRIYAYASSRDLQSAMQLTSRPWVAGHTTPEQNLILISVPSGPEKNLELQRQIPHEIMHILQYQVMGSNYFSQPVWLVEGMASLAELRPNPEYERVLKEATAAQQIIPFSSLCTTFPQDAGPAFQAYAQSESFVGFLQEKYGSSGLSSLIEQYKNNLGCSDGVKAAFGISLDQLEYRWKQEALGINIGGLVLSNLSPYLLIALLLLLPAGLAFLPYRAPKPARRKV